MAAKITILDQQFRPVTRLGSSAHTKNLAGCAGEIMVAQIDFAYWLGATCENCKLSITATNSDNKSTFLKLETSTDLISAGFSAGDYIYGVFNAYIPVGTAAVVAKNYMTITISIGDVGFYHTLLHEGKAVLMAVNDITTVRFSPNIVNNNIKWNQKEYISGETIEFLALNVGLRTGNDRDTSWLPMVAQGSKNWQINEGDVQAFIDLNKPQIQYVGQYNYDGWPEESYHETWHQKFSIKYAFIIPFYKIGQMNNLLTNVAPKDFGKSKKFTFDLQLGKNQADCGSKKELVFSDTPGSVGWFGSNFAGYPKYTSVESSGFTVGGVDELNISNAIAGKTITTVIKGDASLLSSTWITLYFAKLNADVSEIGDKETYQNDYLILDSVQFKCNNSYYPNNDGNVLRMTGNFFVKAKASLTFVPEVKATLSYDIKLSASQSNKVQDGDKFAVWYVVQDETKYDANAATSNRTSQLIAVGTFIEGEDIEGLADLTDSYVIDESGQQTTDNETWIEDNTKNIFSISLNELTRNNVTYRTRVNSLTLAQVAHNETTDEFFYLSRYDVPLVIKESAGVQLINYSQDREDYILKAGNQFKQVTVESDGEVLDVAFGQKMDWQSWLALESGFADVFFDITKSFDGGAHDASLYSGLNGFKIKNAVLARLEGVNRLGQIGVSNYLFLSNEIGCRTYSTDTAPTDVGGIHGTIKINSSGKTDIAKPIIGKQSTVVAEFIADDGGFISVGSQSWANIRIEEIGESGKVINESSTTFDHDKSVFKNVRALLTAQGGALVATTDVLRSYFDASKSYKVTAKIEVANPIQLSYDFDYMVIKYKYDSFNGSAMVVGGGSGYVRVSKSDNYAIGMTVYSVDKDSLFTISNVTHTSTETWLYFDEPYTYTGNDYISKYVVLNEKNGFVITNKTTSFREGFKIRSYNTATIYTILEVDNDTYTDLTLVKIQGYTPQLSDRLFYRYGGLDLDTATWVTESANASVVDKALGFGATYKTVNLNGTTSPTTVTTAEIPNCLMSFAGDNRVNGYESLILNAKDFLANASNGASLSVRCRAHWYSWQSMQEWDNCMIDFYFETWKDGVMSVVNYEFVNTGGTSPNNITKSVKVPISETGGAVINKATFTQVADITITKLNNNKIIFNVV